MNFSILVNNEQNMTHIPISQNPYENIYIECDKTIKNAKQIYIMISNIRKVQKTAKIHVKCNMIPQIEIILPIIQALTIRLNNDDDFHNFLTMDNRLSTHDTKGKQLTLHVTPNIEINKCEPSHLPLIWEIKQIPKSSIDFDNFEIMLSQ